MINERFWPKHLGEEKTTWVCNAIDVLEARLKQMKEEEPYAVNTLSALRNAIDTLDSWEEDWDEDADSPA